MATVVLNAYSKAYSNIQNKIQASVRLSSSPLAIVASIIDSEQGHPARTWSFAGLLRQNYDFSLDEIDINGVPITNLALFSVVPGELAGMLSRADEQIMVGSTTGFNTGDNTFVFDGTNSKPNYIGWEIVPSELTGRGILVKGLDFSWNKDTATFLLLQNADVFQADNHYNIHFNPINNTAGNSVGNNTDFLIRDITQTGDILLSDLGNTVMCSPTIGYQELTLPELNTVPTGRKLTIEAKGFGTSKIKPFGADIIIFPKNYIFIMQSESIEMYAYNENGIKKWKTTNENGNFRTVGDTLVKPFYNPIITEALNIKPLFVNYIILDKFVNARIYDYILNLPQSEVSSYNDWQNINKNKCLYSYADSTNPSFQDAFFLPCRTCLISFNHNSGDLNSVLEYQDAKIIGNSIGIVAGSKVFKNYPYIKI